MDAAQGYLQVLAACAKYCGVKAGCRGYVQLDVQLDGNQQDMALKVGGSFMIDTSKSAAPGDAAQYLHLGLNKLQLRCISHLISPILQNLECCGPGDVQPPIILKVFLVRPPSG
jgi:hypothetical protein